MIFHTHYFKPSEKNSEILYCTCGDTKDIHRHLWELHREIISNYSGKVIGNVKKCSVCGEHKNFKLTD
jgi:hypothetical protein